MKTLMGTVDTLVTATQALVSWLDNSYLQRTAKEQSNLLKNIAPLLATFPYRPTKAVLYHLASEKHEPTLPAKMAHSCTFGKGEPFWTKLAAGLHMMGEEVVVYKVAGVYTELFSVAWVEKNVLDHLKSKCTNGRDSVYSPYNRVYRDLFTYARAILRRK